MEDDHRCRRGRFTSLNVGSLINTPSGRDMPAVANGEENPMNYIEDFYNARDEDGSGTTESIENIRSDKPDASKQS